MTSPGSGIPDSSGLLWRSALRHACQRRWQTGLNILGITIGVMMVVAVDLANSSARQAFENSIDILNGTITHQVVGGSDGVSDTVFTRLKTELGIRRAAPAIRGQVMIGDRELTLAGIDVISEAAIQRKRPGLPADAYAVNGALVSIIGRTDSIVMPDTLAAELGLVVGDSASVSGFSGSRNARLTAVFSNRNGPGTGDLVLADIAAAQRLLGRPGRIDSIDLVLDETEAAALARWLPPGLLLAEARARAENRQQMSDAFHINLLAMSLLSLLVAGLLIYNTVTLSVIQRRQTLGILRSQGVTRRQLWWLVMAENGATGLIASLAGILAGYLLGSFLVTMVTRTVDDLYFDLVVTGFYVDPLVLAKGLMLGVLLSLVSATLPAWQAAHSRPITLQHQDSDTDDRVRRIVWLALAGGTLMLAGWAMVVPEYGSLVTGFVALTLIVLGFCLLVPLFLHVLLSLVLATGINFMGLPATMALRNARSAINRTGLAAAALCVAVSVTVGVGVMVGSFRGTVIVWLEQSLPGDIQLTASEGELSVTGIPVSLRSDIGSVPGVTGVHDSVLTQVESEFGPVRLGVNDIPAEEKFYLKEALVDGMERFNRGEGVLISEPLAWQQRLAPGEPIRLLTNSGMREFPVLGIFFDYTSGSALVSMHANGYRRYWSGRPFTRLALDTDDSMNQEEIEAAIRSRLAGLNGRFNLVSNRELRELTLQIFDRTFAITNVLRLLAILVAFVGVVSTLMALQLERGREFAILRATGMTQGQVAGLIVRQTTALGLCAGMLALPLGLVMSDVLIDVINRRSFGWTMQHFLPQSVLVEALLLAVVAAVLAGLYPAWRAGRIRPAIALREE